MYTCERSIQKLLEYLDGEIPESEEHALEEHLSGCPPCVEFVRSYRTTSDLCRQHLARKMPHEMADKLKAFLRAKLTSK